MFVETTLFQSLTDLSFSPQGAQYTLDKKSISDGEAQSQIAGHPICSFKRKIALS